MAGENVNQGEIPYDPNQMVELRTEWQDLQVPTETPRGVSSTVGDQEGETATTSTVTRAGSSISEMRVCQETFRQAMERALADFPADQLSVTPNFEQIAEGPATPVDTSTVDGKPAVIPSQTIDEAVPTASFGDLKDSLAGLQDRLQDLLANLDLEVDYEKTDRGSRVRIRNRAEEATPTDTMVPESEEPAAPSHAAPASESEPEVHEIHHRLARRGMVTVSVRPSGSAQPTADGDFGSAANNNTVGYINKRTKGLIVNEFGQLYSVINLALNLNVLIGVEND